MGQCRGILGKTNAKAGVALIGGGRGKVTD